ncbi:MAG TPA: phosphatidate cytidylyltransferase [Pirellulales bacterium]|jgi:phosphatidate cytidylyltransferase|nr:phosphatidate cytidylyltransferase [Pirellulales bacterium]
MLRWRLLLGTLLIAGLVGLCWLDARSSVPGVWLLPLALLIAVLGSGEMIWMLRQRGIEPWAGVIYMANFAMVVASELHRTTAIANSVLAALALATVAALAYEVQRYRGPGQSIERLGATTFAMVYIGILLAVVVQLRWVLDQSILPLLSMIVVVKCCDTGAYTVGRLVGRNKMTPLLSPGKTWEGAAGGVAFGCLGAWLTLTFFGELVSTRASLVYGAIISIAGIIGDLAESLIKRECGCKDSSPWLPGFGGVLDMVDSILFAAPVAVVWWDHWLGMQAT